MNKANSFSLIRSVLRWRRPAITLSLLLGASNLTPLFATNPRYVYQGKDSNNITVNLVVEGGTPDSVTGSIYDGLSSCAAIVTNGTLIGSVINAGVTYNVGGQPAVSNLVGTLTGTLGATSSVLQVDAFIFCNVAFVQVVATLDLVPPLITTVPAHPISPRVTPLLPASETMSGGYSLGTTWSASITLTTRLQGLAYNVVGVLTVDQFIGCPGLVSPVLFPCTPHSELTALPFSGVLTPGAQGQLSINNAPPGSNPVFYATISSSGTSFTSLLEGLPSLGITHLYLNANP